MPKHLLVVDDDPAVRRSLGRALEEGGHKVSYASNAEEGVAVFDRALPDLVILDLFLPDQHGLEVLKRIRGRDPDAAVIVVTASDKATDAVKAMKLGALEYLVKPYDLEALMVFVQKALDQSRTRMELGAHRKSQSERYSFDAMECANAGYASVISLARKLAESPTMTLLVEGETGVGKEFVARAVHHVSPRSEGPFIAISCAAIPDALLESELFGHEAGAFTDARGRKKGLFELADDGTLLLDEIGEMSPAVQAKLLRAIETRSFRRVGGTEDIVVDTRIIAATNVVIERAVAEKRFREDLYYRLKVGHLVIPPLRDRQEDLLPLADRLLIEICRDLGRRGLVLSPEVREAFTRYRWPGNVRELRNVLERAVILKEGEGPIELSHLPREIQGALPAVEPDSVPAAADRPLKEVEREHIFRVLKACSGNHARAARVLGISRTTIWEKLKQYRKAPAG